MLAEQMWPLSKVKGHATSGDVQKGYVSARNKHGNDAADALATSAAHSHALPARAVQEVFYRRRVVRDVQLMMVDILSARSQSLAAHCSDGSCSHASSTPMSRSSSTERASEKSESFSNVSSSISCSSSSFSFLDFAQLAIHTGSDHPT